jgi:hypothetical protein
MNPISRRTLWRLLLYTLCTFTLTGCPIPKPRIAPPSGLYNCPMTVTITSRASDSQVLYTLDGSAPSSSSNKYGGPFLIDSNQRVRAIAIAPGTKHSDVDSVAYSCAPTKVTRADFAKVIQHQFDLPQPSPAITFGDVKPGDPIYPAIEAIAPHLHRQLLCPGCHLSTYFFPAAQISRAEVAVIFVSILLGERKVQLPSLAEANLFLNDVADAQELPKTARQYIVAAIKNNLLNLQTGRRIDGYQPYSQSDMNGSLATMQQRLSILPKSPQ